MLLAATKYDKYTLILDTYLYGFVSNFGDVPLTVRDFAIGIVK